MKNYYDMLGVTENASNDQIKKAFKNIAKKEHPDRGGNEKRFKEANEAYDTLKDKEDLVMIYLKNSFLVLVLEIKVAILLDELIVQDLEVIKV